MFHECDRECEAYTDKDHPIPGRWEIEGMKFRRCPKIMIDPAVGWYITAYNFYKNGITPNGEGWQQESNKYVEAMEFIDAKIAEHQRENAPNGK